MAKMANGKKKDGKVSASAPRFSALAAASASLWCFSERSDQACTVVKNLSF